MAGRGNPNWVKGISGNPKGRPPQLSPIRDLAREYTEEALMALVDEVRNRGPDRIAATNSILDRAWGKPKQELEHTGEGGPVIVVWQGEEMLAKSRDTIHAENPVRSLPSPN